MKTTETIPSRRKGELCHVAALLSLLLLFSGSRLSAQALTLGNPHWNITLTDYGYSDFLLDNTPGFEGREYLSGEWGAAVAYQVTGDPPTSPKWLEPNFTYPDWATGSPFHVVTPIVQTGLNADNLPIAQSVIANSDLEITLRHEMLDTVVGIPMGITPASSASPAEAITSSRYVLKQTCTIKNISGKTISNLQLFQLLHGLHSQRGVFDNHTYLGPFSDFHQDITMAGVDPWAVGPGSSGSGLEDFMTFHATQAPSAFELGTYGTEGNGVDDHWSGKPSDGVHFSVENNWQTTPFSTRQGTDNFHPPALWVAGAQRWELGTLAAGQSVSLDVLLSVRTGTVVSPGPGSSGGCNGGSGVPGGLDYEFDDVSTEGSCFGEYSQSDEAERSVRVANGEFEPFDFPIPGEPAQIWDVAFSGTFTGQAHLTVGYDPSILPPGFDQDTLCLYQFNGSAWVKLSSTVNSTAHTITVATTSLTPLALAADSVTSFSVTATVSPAASGTVTGAGSYVQGSGVSLVATPNAGHAFSHWSEGATVVSTSPSLTFILQADRTLQANFVTVVGTEKTIATTSLPAAGGTTSGDGAYAQDTLATVVAVPAPGYKFSKWLEGETVLSTSATFSFTVAGDRTLVAKFKPVYTLTISAEPADAGEVEGDPFYEVGELVKLKAKPNTGYSFVNWTQNGAPISDDPNFQFNMTGNRELVGHFAAGVRLDLSSIPPHAGTTSGGGVHPVDSGVTVTATPVAGYVFVNWTEAGTPVSSSESYGFTASSPRTLVANFALDTLSSTAPVAGNDTVHCQVNRQLKLPMADLLANDSSPLSLPLTLTAVDATSANGGQLQLLGSWIFLDPPAGSVASDSFHYTVSDGTEQTIGFVTVLMDPEPDTTTLNITASVLTNSGGTDEMHLHAACIPGRSYRLQTTTDLTSPVTWENLGDAQVAPANGQLEFVDPAPAGSVFYRVVEGN